MNACPYCKRPDAGDPSDYYHEKDCAREYWAKQMREATTENERLIARGNYESACYTGD